MGVLPLEASAEQNESTRNEINDEMEMDHVIESTNTTTEDQSQDSAIVSTTNPQSVTDVQSSGSADVAFENIPEGEQIMPKKKGKRRHYKASEKLKILKLWDTEAGPTKVRTTYGVDRDSICKWKRKQVK